jgi:hypothetical protein
MAGHAPHGVFLKALTAVRLETCRTVAWLIERKWLMVRTVKGESPSQSPLPSKRIISRSEFSFSTGRSRRGGSPLTISPLGRFDPIHGLAKEPKSKAPDSKRQDSGGWADSRWNAERCDHPPADGDMVQGTDSHTRAKTPKGPGRLAQSNLTTPDNTVVSTGHAG